MSLVGRDDARRQLGDVFRLARSGRGAVVAIVGEPGMGKSRVLAAAAEDAREQGFKVLWGRCWADAGAPAFWPWSQALSELATTVTLDDSRLRGLQGAADLVRLVPALEGALAPEPVDAVIAHRDFYCREAASEILRVAAEQAPIAVFVDDLHWADVSSLRLVDHLRGTVVDSRVAVIVAARPAAPAPDAIEPFARLLSNTSRVPLRDLTAAEIAQLVEQQRGSPPTADEVDALRDLTGGNPFHVVDLIGDASWQASSSGLPHRSGALLHGRLLALAPEARRVLAAAAVLGRRSDLDLVAEVTGGRAEDVHRHLALAAASRLVSLLPGGEVEFVHALAHEATYETIPDAQRMDLHGRAARALERRWSVLADEHAAEIAHHLVRAGSQPTELVRTWCARAGRRAAERCAQEDAARWLQVALDHLDPDVSLDERIQLLLDLGSALVNGTGSARGGSAFRDAHRLARDLDDPVLLAVAAIGMAEAAYRAAGPVGGDEVANALALATAALPRSEHELHFRLAEQTARHAAIGGSVDEQEAAVRGLIERSVHPGVAESGAAASALRWALVGPSPLASKRAASAALLDQASGRGDLEARWEAHRWLLLDALEAGVGSEVSQQLAACQTLASKLDVSFVTATTDVITAAVALMEGRFDRARRLGDDALATIQAAEMDPAPVMAQRSVLLRDVGDRDELNALVELLGAALPERGDAARMVRALVLAEAGLVEEARGELDRLVVDGFASVPRDAFWLDALALASITAIQVGHRGAADALRSLLRSARDRCIVAGAGPYLFFGAVAHHTGALASYLGDLDEAVADLTAALALHEALDARPWQARTHLELGAAFARRGAFGDLAAGRAHLQQAGGIAAELGTPEVVAEARRHERELAAVLTVEPDGLLWVIRPADGPAFHLEGSKGLRCLQHLLDRPGAAIPAATLVEQALGEAAADPERARVNVTRQLRSAVEAVAAHDLALAQHLRASLRTGTRCSYHPPGLPPAATT